MIKKLLYFNLLLLVSVSGGILNAQEYCSFDDVNERYLAQNPQIKQMINIAEKEMSLAMESGKLFHKNTGQIYEIPVVVHVFADDSPLGTLGNPSDTQIQEWINFTNQLYENSYYEGNSSTVFPFRLVLAKRDPSCENTNGIERFDLSHNQDYNEFGLIYTGTKGITEAELRKMSRWDPRSYYNIYVTNKIDGFDGSSGGGTNGYAYLYGAAGNSVDGAYHHSGVVGIKPTLGHEIGHALGLYHTFGQKSSTTECQTTSANNPYTTGDLVADTSPTINGNYYRQVYGVSQPTSAIINGCTNEPFDDVVTNVMNYGSYRNKFTQGQADRSVSLFLQFRSSLLSSKALVPVDENESQIVLIESCIPSPSTLLQGAYGYGISGVKFGDINVASSPKDGSNAYYTDYSKKCLIKNTFTEVYEGRTYEMILSEKTANPVSFIAYLDFNNDGVFTENEIILPKVNIPAETGVWTEKSHTFSIHIPNNVVKNKPLRLRVIGDSSNASFGACDTRSRGEIEDYAVVIKSNTTVWNGESWSEGVPDITKEAIVRGNLLLSTDLIANKITLETGSVIIKTGSVLKVENEILNNLTADKFIIEDGANIIQRNSDAINTGEFTVIANSTPMIFNDAMLWSSPVEGQNVRSFSVNTLEKRFYIYNEQTNKFASLFVNDPLYPNSNLQNPATYNFENGLGYHIRVSNNHTQVKPGSIFKGKFIGTLNNGIIQQVVKKDNLGYNLIGNPYPSSIDAVKFFDSNPSVQTIYFWTHEAPLTSSGYASNNYASFNLTGGTQAAAGGIVPNGIIAKGQGFIVETDEATILSFDNIHRTDDLSAILFKNQDESKRIWINLFEGTQAKNQILIGYIKGATNGFDPRMDAKLNPNYDGSVVYSLIDKLVDRFVIQGRGLPFSTEDVVKLGFEAKSNASYTIELDNTENIADDMAIFLYDKEEKQVVDLRKQAYTFTSQIGVYDERFEVIYMNKTLGVNDIPKRETIVFKNNNAIVIESLKEIKSIEVYDISGRLILSKSTSGKKVSLTNLPKLNEVLVIKIINTDQTITSTKILF